MVGITPVELEGTYREQGRQHGEALASVIVEIIGEVLTWVQVLGGAILIGGCYLVIRIRFGLMNFTDRRPGED